MAKPYSVDINGANMQNLDTTNIDLPPANGVDVFSGSDSTVLPSLPYDAGDLILLNIGQDLTYTLSDGTVITFGSSILSGAYSGHASDVSSSTEPYSGPYCAIAPSLVNLMDEATIDIQHVGTALSYDENSKKVPIQWVSGPEQVSGLHILDGAVSIAHQVRAHHDRGNFTGGTLAIANQSAAFFLYVGLTYNPLDPDTYLYVTDDGRGDGTNPGAYRIAGPIGPTELGRAFIWPVGDIAFSASCFPADPGGCIITFTALFPLAVTRSTTTGSLSATDDYSVRWCYTKSWNGVTLESALSPAVDITGSTGYVFDVGGLPKNWTGIRLYYCDISTGGIVDQQNIRSTTAVYNSGAGTLTWTSVSGDLIPSPPSYGFFAWPAGTDLTIPGHSDIMKVGHLSNKIDVGTNLYPFHSFNAGVTPATTIHTAPGAISGGQDDGTGGGTQLPGHLHALSIHPPTHLHSMDSQSSIVPLAAGLAPVSDGSGNVDWSSAPVGDMVNPMTTLGDMIRGGASGVPTRLPVPSSPAVLVNPGSAAPSWQVMAISNYNLLYANASGIGLASTTLPGQIPITDASGSGSVAFKNILRGGVIPIALDGSGNGDQAISYSQAFANTPVVTGTPTDDWNDSGSPAKSARWWIDSVSTTGCTAHVRAAINKASTTVNLMVVAVDQG